MAGRAYDELSYPGFAYTSTHPARVEVLARLFGLSPAPADACRLLEIGCGDGGNILSMAQTLPGSTFVGIDASEGGIARGSRLAAAAGLGNVTLRVEDLEHLSAEPGSFDYIVAHGVYSWIPPRARGALLARCADLLTPDGVAYVSYNAYPGSYLRDMARDILLYHLRDIEGAGARLEGAHALMATMVQIADPSPFSRVLREQMQRTLHFPDALLFHDDLAEISTPFYFHEFMEHASAHGLRFLSEANLHESQMRDMPDSAAVLMASLPADVVVQEQYLDFFKNRMFRQTLLCHAEAPVQRELHDDELERMEFTSAARPQPPETQAEGSPSRGSRAGTQDTEGTFALPDGATLTTSEPLLRSAMHVLAEAWPAALSFPALLASALDATEPPIPHEQAADRLRAVMLEAYTVGVVELLSVAPPLASGTPGQHPRASALARAQCAQGAEVVSTLLHTNVGLQDELERRLLCRLDGTCERAALAHVVGCTEVELDLALNRLAELGLLMVA